MASYLLAMAFTPVWGWTAALHPFADFEHIDIGNEGPSN